MNNKSFIFNISIFILAEAVNSINHNAKESPTNKEDVNEVNSIQIYKKSSSTNLPSWFANIIKPQI